MFDRGSIALGTMIGIVASIFVYVLLSSDATISDKFGRYFLSAGAVLFGAFISLCTSLILQNRQLQVERKKDEQIEHRKKCERAMHIFSGLIEMHHHHANTFRHVDEAFAENNELENPLEEPCAIVQSIEGPLAPDKFFERSALVLMLELQEFELYLNLDLAEKRVLAALNSVQRYGERRNRSFDSMILTKLDGTLGVAELEGVDAMRAEREVHVLNNLLGQILENAERDAKNIPELLEKLRQAVTRHLGYTLPPFELV